MNKLLILAEDAEDYFPLVVAEDLPQLDVVSASESEKALALVADCNIILGEPPLIVDVLESAGQMKWVQSSWAGVDRLCHPGLRHDYVLTGVKGIFGPLISEYVLTYLFALETLATQNIPSCQRCYVGHRRPGVYRSAPCPYCPMLRAPGDGPEPVR